MIDHSAKPTVGICQKCPHSDFCHQQNRCEVDALFVTPAVGGEALRDAIMGAARLYTHDHTTAHKIAETVMATLATLAATPAVGGLAEATIELNGLLDKYWMGYHSETNIIAIGAAQQKCKNALAAQPASPLRGRDRDELVKKISAAMSEGKDSGGYDTLFDMLAHIALKVIDAAPPEQPAAVTGQEAKALEAIMQRANESGIGEMALIDTIHAMHKLASVALDGYVAPEQPTKKEIANELDN